jgi:prepilin-type N-terminal cleavage/methylation domain-containing protein
MTRDRKGFTLVELLVVTVLGTLVLLAALQVLITNQRTYAAQNAVISNQQSTRIALEVLMNELRELSPPGGDIISMSQDELSVRLMRKFSIVCATDYSGVGLGNFAVVVLDLPGPDLAAGDSVFVFANNDEGRDDDDVWIKTRIGTVSNTTCPQNSEAAIRLAFGGLASLFITDSVGVGAPARSFQHFTFGLTTYNGDTYLGRRPGFGTTGTWVPVAGPLDPATGIEFVYRDALGAVTTTPEDVRQIVVRIRSESVMRNSLNRPVVDSITAWIYARN